LSQTACLGTHLDLHPEGLLGRKGHGSTAAVGVLSTEIQDQAPIGVLLDLYRVERCPDRGRPRPTEIPLRKGIRRGWQKESKDTQNPQGVARRHGPSPCQAGDRTKADLQPGPVLSNVPRRQLLDRRVEWGSEILSPSGLCILDGKTQLDESSTAGGPSGRILP
jgi:hypothetical protein